MLKRFLSKNYSIENALIRLGARHEGSLSHSIHAANVAAHLVTSVQIRHIQVGNDDVAVIALLHDIGKLGTPTKILEKNGKLTDKEMMSIKKHPARGKDILYTSGDEKIQVYANIVGQHHELPDGSGYPGNLHLDEIHPASRLLNITDRFAALTEDRAYRKAMPTKTALEIIREDISKFFDDGDAIKVVDTLAKFDAQESHMKTAAFKLPLDASISKVIVKITN